MRTDPRDESPVEAACVALRPYQWRGLTPELFTRWVLAAGDRERVRRVLADVPGVALGSWGVLEPADRDDVRVGALVGFLVSHRWTELSLSTVCTQLLGLLDRRTRSGARHRRWRALRPVAQARLADGGRVPRPDRPIRPGGGTRRVLAGRQLQPACGPRGR